jgi:MSHA biogenesis protein MshO
MRAADVICPGAARVRGMTLIELIVVIMLTGIVASMAAVFVLRPVQGYVDLGRRAELVDAAESALRRMTRDIRLAAPNSVRVTNVGLGFALELLPVVDGARYATDPSYTDCENLTGFDPAAADDNFDILGTFGTLATGTPAGHRLLINNIGAGSTHDVYADGVSPSPAAPLVITPVGTTITIALNPVAGCPANGKHHITLSAAHQFRVSSPRERVFVVTTPVSYLCDPGAGTLVRYAGYPIQATQPTTAAALNALAGASARVADNLELCTAKTTTSQIRDRGLVTLTLTLHDQGERIRLVQQAQLDNSR